MAYPHPYPYPTRKILHTVYVSMSDWIWIFIFVTASNTDTVGYIRCLFALLLICVETDQMWMLLIYPYLFCSPAFMFRNLRCICRSRTFTYKIDTHIFTYNEYLSENNVYIRDQSDWGLFVRTQLILLHLLM